MSQTDDLEDNECKIALAQGRGSKTCMHATVHCIVVDQLPHRLECEPASTARFACTQRQPWTLPLLHDDHDIFDQRIAPDSAVGYVNPSSCGAELLATVCQESRQEVFHTADEDT